MPQLEQDDWPAKSSIAAQLVGNLYRCRNHIWDRDAELLERHKLTWPQFAVLAMLRGESADYSLTPTELCAHLQLTTGGLSKILVLLEKRGLISRRNSDADRRSRPVLLTPEGQILAEELFGQIVNLNENVIRQAMSDEECEELTRLVQKLARFLDGVSKERR